MPAPDNFRKSWFHARDYGLLVANPFGLNAFTRGEKSRIDVPVGKEFRLQFGVLIHRSPAKQPTDLKSAYQDFLNCLTER